MTLHRKQARSLAHESLRRGRPLEWFETLYHQAGGDPAVIPWADMAVNPNLSAWLARTDLIAAQRQALVIGCGLGDDAEALCAAGFRVTAFDISDTCIAWCRRRFPESSVGYCVADLFSPPPAWQRAFDFVLETYTLQVLPENLRATAIRQIADFVAGDGRLLVITRGRDAADDPGAMPWPLLQSELSEFARAGLIELTFEDYLDSEDPPVRRFRVEYRRPACESNFMS
ncbi:MAG: class I SAM-dependent methyltransferase [Pirellulales bacterium]